MRKRAQNAIDSELCSGFSTLLHLSGYAATRTGDMMLRVAGMCCYAYWCHAPTLCCCSYWAYAASWRGAVLLRVLVLDYDAMRSDDITLRVAGLCCYAHWCYDSTRRRARVKKG
eukprot:3085917-Rhodomonas_salina.1